MRPATPLSRSSVCLMFALATVIALRTSLDARQGQGRGQGAGPAQATPADPVPTSAASIVMNPAAYLGRTVTITASVVRQLSSTAFTVGQNRGTAQGEVLIIAPVLTSAPALNDYLTVIGDAVAFEPADVTRRLKGGTLNLPADVVAAFLGKPAIVATAILTSDLSDLTKRKPAPMTPDDEKLSAIMKRVSPAATALRTVAADDLATKAAKTAELKKLFTEAQDVFKARNITTAVTWSGDALKALDVADVPALTQTCTTCHNAHRARQDDGTYRLKSGGH